MKLLQTLTSLALFCIAGNATAASMSLNQFPHKVLPVLVHVDSHGKVTSAAPAFELRPELTRLLRENLDEMITRPANRDGRDVSSQFVINLAVRSTPREDGRYDVQFAYVSTAPVPSGSWYWVHQDGHRLALARQGSFNRGPSHHFDRVPRHDTLPSLDRRTAPANTPTRTATHNKARATSPRR